MFWVPSGSGPIHILGKGPTQCKKGFPPFVLLSFCLMNFGQSSKSTLQAATEVCSNVRLPRRNTTQVLFFPQGSTTQVLFLS